MSAVDDKRQAALERRRAINACRLCDDQGWVLGRDGLESDWARKCRHGDTGHRDEWGLRGDR